MQDVDTDFLHEEPNTTAQSTLGQIFSLTIAVYSLTATDSTVARQTRQSTVYNTDNSLRESEGFFQLLIGIGTFGLAVICQPKHSHHHDRLVLKKQTTNGQSKDEEDDA